MSDTFHRPKKNEDYKNKLTVTCYLNKINCIKRASKLHKRRTAGLQITNGRRRSCCPVKHVFAWTLPVFGRSNFNSRNSSDSKPKLHSNPIITKKQLNPSRFGNKNYKLIVLLLFTAEAASHSVRGTVTQDITAIVRFTLHLRKITYN